MAETLKPNLVDSQFYKPADSFFPAHPHIALTYDDVTLATLYSEILPRNTALDTTLTEGLHLNLPIISADMDTVTESPMAIAMSLNGGLGLIHYNMPEDEQLREVARVKNHVHGLIQEPASVSPSMWVGDVLKLMEDDKHAFSTFPVVNARGKLAGLLPGSVIKPRYATRRVAEVAIPRKDVHAIKESTLDPDPIAVADKFFTANPGINKLLVVDQHDRLRGLFTLSDVDRIMQEKKAQFKPARDSEFRLLCGAALAATRDATGNLDRRRIRAHVNALVQRGVDVIAVSTAHGHTSGVGETVRLIRQIHPRLPIIAGNVTTAEGVDFLARCGANIVKVGQGPGSICTTRVVAGVGIPQLTALYITSRAAAKANVTVLADGGIVKSGDIVKALTLAHGVVCGGLLAGCSEAPGKILEIGGKLYKQYRGMGSLAAMQAGSASRYGHRKGATQKVAAEGVEALKEAAGPVDQVLTQLIGGIQSGMGYLGSPNLSELRQKARYIRVSPAGQREAGAHDVLEMKTPH